MQSPAGTNAPEADLAEVEMHKATIDAANNASDPRAAQIALSFGAGGGRGLVRGRMSDGGGGEGVPANFHILRILKCKLAVNTEIE